MANTKNVTITLTPSQVDFLMTVMVIAGTEDYKFTADEEAAGDAIWRALNPHDSMCGVEGFFCDDCISESSDYSPDNDIGE